jgi:hypothetical protein
MRNTTDVTPAEAKAVWDSIENPSAREVSRLLAAQGRLVGFKTVSEWKNAGWPERTERPRVASTTHEGLNRSIAAITGKANATLADLPPIAPLAPDLPIVLALEMTCRDGLNAAHSVFRLVETEPTLIAAMPANIGVLLEKTGTLLAKLAEALLARDGIVERGMKAAGSTGRTRENDPLLRSLEAWEKFRHPPKRSSL